MAFGYETKAGLPERGATYGILLDHLREAQKHAAVLAHLHSTETGAKDRLIAQGWLMIAELLRRMQHQITELAKGKLLQ